jgi:hypothetical protein
VGNVVRNLCRHGCPHLFDPVRDVVYWNRNDEPMVTPNLLDEALRVSEVFRFIQRQFAKQHAATPCIEIVRHPAADHSYLRMPSFYAFHLVVVNASVALIVNMQEKPS